MKTFNSFRSSLEEKKLTPAEMKKREEVAKAIHRENPNMPMGMKMAIATKTAKRVAEEEELDEANEYHKIAAKHLKDMMKKDVTSTQKEYARKMNKRALEAAKMSDPEAAKKHYMGVNEEEELEELNQMTLQRYASKAYRVGMQGGPKSAKHLAGAQRAKEKLKYGDYSEEVEQVDEVSKKTAVSYIQKKVSQIAKRPGEAMLYTTKMDNKDYTNLKKAYKRAGVKEEVKDEYARKVDMYLKKKYNKEEFELDEATQFPSKEHAISYAKEKVKSHKDSDDGIEVYSMPGGGARVVHTMNSQGRQQVLKGGGKKVTTVTREEVELDETKSAPKGFHFTKDGKLKRGDADQDGSGGPMLRSDPLDKQRSKVPPVSEGIVDTAAAARKKIFSTSKNKLDSLFKTAHPDGAKRMSEQDDSEGEHYCAKHVYSNVHGEGTVLEGMHAEPDENGNIEWYVVEFSAGPRKVFTEKLDIMIAEYHGNHKKKRMTNGG